MKQKEIVRIKSAGKSLVGISNLMILQIIILFIAFLHIKFSEINNYAIVIGIYCIIILFISIGVIIGFLSAGNNLLNIEKEIDINTENKYTNENESFFIETSDHKTLELMIVNPNDLIGTIVLMDGKFAPDGEYEFLKDKTIITISNGIIEQVI